jgi:hypothetical protein
MKDLENSYREAVYSIHNSGIYIKVGHHNEELDHILEEYHADSWAFITAWNPGGKPLTLEENLKRQIKLLMEIKDLILMEGHGQAKDGSWSEDSFLVVGMSQSQATDICSKYGQLAFLYGDKGETAKLVFI